MDPDGVRAAQRELYEAGEYHALSATLLPAAEELVRRAGVRPGWRLLDVGAGDGNVALAGGARGAEVVALDLSPVQLYRARERWVGLDCVCASAELLPFADGSFDAVLSCFGAVFAPDPDLVVAEAFRVCRPGGVVGFTAWPPDSLTGEMTAAARAASPEPGSFPDQELGWGVEAVARARFEPHAREVASYRLSFLQDPAVRGAAGSADCAGRYLAEHVPGLDLAEIRTGVLQRHLNGEGELISEYLLVLGTR